MRKDVRIEDRSDAISVQAKKKFDKSLLQMQSALSLAASKGVVTEDERARFAARLADAVRELGATW